MLIRHRRGSPRHLDRRAFDDTFDPGGPRPTCGRPASWPTASTPTHLRAYRMPTARCVACGRAAPGTATSRGRTSTSGLRSTCRTWPPGSSRFPLTSERRHRAHATGQASEHRRRADQDASCGQGHAPRGCWTLPAATRRLQTVRDVVAAWSRTIDVDGVPRRRCRRERDVQSDGSVSSRTETALAASVNARASPCAAVPQRPAARRSRVPWEDFRRRRRRVRSLQARRLPRRRQASTTRMTSCGTKLVRRGPRAVERASTTSSLDGRRTSVDDGQRRSARIPRLTTRGRALARMTSPDSLRAVITIRTS